MDIIKEDPPARTRKSQGSEHYRTLADDLKADPGAWYRIAEGQKQAGLAAQIKTGKIVAFQPAGDFEATARKVPSEPGSAAYLEAPGGTWSIWARYVGEEGHAIA